jgi:hypothetical protein
MRCRALAKALGVPFHLSVRGSGATRYSGPGLHLTRAVDWRAVDAVVVDDPSVRHARAWLARATSAGVVTVVIHDLGVRAGEADLTVDGSLTIELKEEAYRGPRFMILDPRLVAARAKRRRPTSIRRGRVLIALGGGSSAVSVVPSLARSLARECPGVIVEVAAGFAGRVKSHLTSGRWIERPDGLVRDLARADVAVVAGGITLYEACAVGVPSVAVSVVSAQRHAIQAFAARGAVIDAGPADGGAAERVARAVAELLASRAARQRISAAGKRLVDGRGALRVAARLRQIAGRRR